MTFASAHGATEASPCTARTLKTPGEGQMDHGECDEANTLAERELVRQAAVANDRSNASSPTFHSHRTDIGFSYLSGDPDGA
jgi:hypothetical protein